MTTKLEESLTASLDAVTETVEIYGIYNASVTGTFEGDVYIERSFNGGSTFEVVNVYTSTDVVNSYIGREVETGILYRFRFGVFTSGTPTCRIGKGTNY